MGKEIVYCGGCGKSLLEAEFARGKAQTVDGRAFCRKCRPFEPPSATPIPHVPRKSTSTKVPPSLSSSVKLSALGRDSRKLLLAGGALAAAAVVALVAILAGGGEGPPPPPPPPHVALPPPGPTPPSVPIDFAEPILRELERLEAAEPDPETLLARCEGARSTLLGTRHEARLRAIEERARLRKAEKERDQETLALIDAARKAAENDANFLNENRVKALYQAALEVAGPLRAPEIREMARAYEEAARRAKPKVTPPPARQELAVVSLTLVDAKAQPIAGFDPIPPDATVDLSKLPTRDVNLRANTVPDRPRSVVFGIDDNRQYHVENSFPYTIMGDSPYFSWQPPPGRHSFIAVPYSEADGAGTPGRELRLTLTIVDRASDPPSGPGTLLFAEHFDQGAGKFEGGELQPLGINNTNAIVVSPSGVTARGAFSVTAQEGTVIRFRLKALTNVERFTVMTWSGKHKDHARAFVPGLKKGAWRSITVKTTDLKLGPGNGGASLAGQVLDNLEFQVQGPQDARVLVDEVQIWNGPPR